MLIIAIVGSYLLVRSFGVTSASSTGSTATSQDGSLNSLASANPDTEVLGTSNDSVSQPVPSTIPPKQSIAAAQPDSFSTKYPADILNLSNWKLTLPTGPVTKATEIKQPQLASFSVNPWFESNAAGDGVVFRAPVACTAKTTGPSCGSKTSAGTSYARSELREMTNDGKTNAAWDMSAGTHTFEVNLAFMRLPAVKPHLVGAQIHDGKDDVTVLRLEGTKLWITQGHTSHYKLITSDYTLGTKVNLKYVAAGGQVQIYYNGALTATLPSVSTSNYFKTGAYTQANCDNSSPCDGNVNYGEVHVYSVNVTHGE